MKKISFNDYIPKELADNESCRLITTEQYREYQLLKKKLDIAVEALKAIAQNSPDKNIQEIGLLCINNYYLAQKTLQKIEEV